MIKTLGKLSLATVLAALVVGMPMTMSAQTNSTNSAAKAATPSLNHLTAGKVASVDAAGKSFTIVNGKKFATATDTTITLDGKKATLADVVKGQKVAGSYLVNADGSFTAKTLKFTTPAGTK